MDNPQHYQPLSHALHPPLSNSNSSFQKVAHPHYEEEEEEDGDEGAVEEQLDQDMDSESRQDQRDDATPGGDHARSNNNPPAGTSQSAEQHLQQSAQSEGERKRKPGRPRGSKNKKGRMISTVDLTNTRPPTVPAQQHGFYQYTPGGQPGEVNSNNQQYYEFQWRVLSLCAEFYGAAEELVKGTSSLVIAQCYQMGPGVKVDPLAMLNEARRICDQLLSNPARLTAHPPPPIYPVIPGYAHIPPPAPAPSASNNGIPAGGSPAPVISNPQSFVVPMGSQPTMAYPPVYGNTHQYPTAPYYQYPGYTTYYSASMAQPAQPTAQAAPHTAATSISTPLGVSAGNQGAWSDEETERLKQLAEQSRGRGAGAEIDWDWIIAQWGNTRTRHQILIKATGLGLKESTSRGLKRRRETEGSVDRTVPSEPTPTSGEQPAQQPASQSPATSTPAPPSAQPSPAIQAASTSQPSASSSVTPVSGGTTTSRLPWPMPTVASTSSPVIAPSTVAHPSNTDRANNSNYYRSRPPQTTSSSAGKSPSTSGHGATHQYNMYQPNGPRRDG
ncbi:hypothetical protein CONPUDRAFT_135546 [Coniophora puteana RWD-64-598 SS2]|uniref:Myb-like domain-containing protein n=1 Tax=Coniophora puteana (strain RWD-64-598) TaxID=741705 RepID=A0A5M3MXZ6_CONPW|nr:uncharacterized protein CONPUDRAFT_135546 [Coniophora puteana RWD-64-598 SS2]EIW83906.1 hypothetical protein CONPUDRAFT_135546 [Coniophora puteana RWD-64-598 SS2]